MYLLDTNVVSELRKPKPHGGVLAWIEPIPEELLFVSAVTLGEIQRGIERVRRHDRSKAALLDEWADDVAANSNVLPMSGEAFRLWAKLMPGRAETHAMDMMLAATAMIHGLTLATRNVRDFAGLEVALVNPFAPPPA
jgi:toxin FitB